MQTVIIENKNLIFYENTIEFVLESGSILIALDKNF